MNLFLGVCLCLIGALAPVTGWASPLPPEMTEYGVLFQFEDALAEKVHLAGEFNGWNDKSLPMEKKDGKFEIVLPLPVGTYKYKYVIDGSFMTGDDLKVTLVRRDGKLYIYPRQPYLRFPNVSKIDMDGYFLFFNLLTDDVDGPGGRIRSESPRNDLDLNFDIRPSFMDFLKVWMQLNVNTASADRFNLDEAYMELSLGDNTRSLVVRPFETHWLIDFDDPLRLLDEHNYIFDDNIYLTGEARPFYHRYGRYATGFSFDLKRDPWQGYAFFSNKVRLDQSPIDEDVWGFRLKRGGKRLSWGISYVQWQIENGIKASGTFSNEVKTVTDLGPGSIEYPAGSSSYYHMDVLRQVKPGGQNRSIRTAMDFTFTFGRLKLMTEVLVTQNDAAALVYSTGFQRRVFVFAYGQPVTSGAGAAGQERVFGDQSDGLSLMTGAVVEGRTWASELNLKLHNYRATTFSFTTAPVSSDSQLVRVSPDWMEVTHRLLLNRRPDRKWGFELESRYVKRSDLKQGNIFYRERLGAPHYQFSDVAWAKRTLAERIYVEWRLTRAVTWHNKLDWMDLTSFKRFGTLDESFETRIGSSRLNWKLGSRWNLDLGMRYFYVSYDAESTPLKTGFSDEMIKPFAGIKYEWSKLFHIRLWYGLDPYIDEDKRIGAAWRVHDFYKRGAEAIANVGADVGFGLGTLANMGEAAARLDVESIIALQAELRF
ncbi:MAG: hypothetical protein A3G34_09110 [Candidatus Lindowbacteria bacterium RIFCSPLOWO2_12_FULL_62_27]|nr:MAG: hypothetical protein A3I06_03670 [Candidatus Lindowbacteria bacterium RIFCSPLOWO2_02_FULL_62_12]OGH60147.1 MAG: hypothetical protein A3G34_09110 [Candidatus Lindowbacteria bacterium RIFCSPLOWO2_12_FULL_62_27]